MSLSTYLSVANPKNRRKRNVVHREPAAETRRYGDVVIQNGRASSSATPSQFSLQSAVPVLAFLAVNRIAGLRWAVLAATLGSVGVAVDRRRRGQPLGKFMPVVTAAVVIRGVIGIATGSETVYFGLGIATKYLIAAVLLGSAVIGVPLAERGAPFVMRIPQEMAEHRLFRSTMAIITAIAGLYYVTSASFDIWLFRRNSVEGFVLLRFFANWPLSAVTLLAILIVLQVRLQKIPGIPPVATLVEERRSLVTNDHDSTATDSTATGSPVVGGSATDSPVVGGSAADTKPQADD